MEGKKSSKQIFISLILHTHALTSTEICVCSGDLDHCVQRGGVGIVAMMCPPAYWGSLDQQ